MNLGEAAGVTTPFLHVFSKVFNRKWPYTDV